MALTALHSFAAVISALRAAYLGGLDRLTIDTDGTRREFSRPAATRVCSRNRRDCFLPQAPSSPPLGGAVIGSTLGEAFVGQHIPLTPTPMEIPNRVEDFRISTGAGASLLARLSGEQRFHQGPLLVRQIGWIPGLVFFLISLRTPLLMDMR